MRVSVVVRNKIITALKKRRARNIYRYSGTENKEEALVK